MTDKHGREELERYSKTKYQDEEMRMKVKKRT